MIIPGENVDPWKFQHAEGGMTRFPPNVQQITVEVSGPFIWLIARENGTIIRFPLSSADCDHLINLLRKAGRA
ncbi:hypothetical protein [Telmatospirillum sp.]|uniref:hypothetical protein n=1 Tax=Telmatospirillum sp. TaxID=2079197 RepID=UPI00284A206E|nr:hypothetical protein [Telmatospirillum sp.]MDR3438975.1 hypothetical protein [Telmatospirillum sp.]